MVCNGRELMRALNKVESLSERLSSPVTKLKYRDGVLDVYRICNSVKALVRIKAESEENFEIVLPDRLLHKMMEVSGVKDEDVEFKIRGGGIEFKRGNKKYKVMGLNEYVEPFEVNLDSIVGIVKVENFSDYLEMLAKIEPSSYHLSNCVCFSSDGDRLKIFGTNSIELLLIELNKKVEPLEMVIPLTIRKLIDFNSEIELIFTNNGLYIENDNFILFASRREGKIPNIDKILQQTEYMWEIDCKDFLDAFKNSGLVSSEVHFEFIDGNIMKVTASGTGGEVELEFSGRGDFVNFVADSRVWRAIPGLGGLVRLKSNDGHIVLVEYDTFPEYKFAFSTLG